MDRRGSLRGRLGTAGAVGASLLAAVASLAIAILTWQETGNRLLDDTTLAAFVASESDEPLSSPTPENGESPFILTFDDAGEVIGETSSLSQDLVLDLAEDIWVGTDIADEAVVVGYEANGDEAELLAAGVQCTNPDVCDTVIVGVYRQSVVAYLLARAGLIIGPVLLIGVLAGFGARWLVGRSLQPVDRMRIELAEITETNLSSRVEVPGTGDELAELAETFNRTISRLDGAVKANEHFVADAAHELRSPIAGVRAAVELESAKKPGGILDDALVEIDRAGRLIDDLLVLARRQGAGQVKFGDVDMDDLARAEVRHASARFPQVQIQTSIDPVRVSGQEDSLRRLVTNLVENACLYGTGKVYVVVNASKGTPIVEVHDDGPGIPQDQLDRIFERFARLDESRSRVTGGSGLGLAIASEIAVDHGATLRVLRSELGGACFQLTFPSTDS